MLIFFILSIFLGAVSCAQFSNVIEYPKKSDIYRFQIVVDEGLSMAYWNESRKTYQIVVKLNGSFYLRDRRSSTSCGSVFKLTDAEVSTVVKAAGRHKEMLFIDKMLPGPPIVVPWNSNVQVTVTNKMKTDALSLHWHGLNMYKTFFMDGVSRVTQCPIGPGETFVYEFQATELGTYWYHAHSGEQRMDGVYAPLIVTETYLNENGTSPSPYDKEFFFIVQELFENSGDKIVEHIVWEDQKFLYGFDEMNECMKDAYTDDGTPGITFPFIRATDSIIVNGKGSWRIMNMVNKTVQVDSILSLSSDAFNFDLEVFTVEPNKRYLFRGIGANAGHPLEIRIGEHKLTVVATDGSPIKPMTVESLIINGGERYDFYIDTKGPENNLNYFILIKTLETKDANFNEIAQDNFGLAILKYSNVNSQRAMCGDACQPCRSPSCTKLNCPHWPNTNDGLYNCVTLNKLSSAGIPNEDRDLLGTNYTSEKFEEHFFNFHFSGSPSLRSSINGQRFVMPAIPQYLRTDADSVLTACGPSCLQEGTACECTQQVQIGLNKVIQFVIYNMGLGAGPEGNPHPVHIHGHHFYVIKVGYPSYHANNFTYAKSNQDLTCTSDSDVCSRSKWRDSSWAMGNVPGANLVDPPLKDTFFVPVGGYAVIRFRSNNTGYWFMHCHIDVHHSEGMALIIQEGTRDEIAKTVDYSKVNLCSSRLDRVSAILRNSAVNLHAWLVQILGVFVFLLAILIN